jgi:hypothetical protein
MMIGGSIIAMVIMPLGGLIDWDAPFVAAAVCWLSLVFVACFLAVWGCFHLRFELAGGAKALHATASAPVSFAVPRKDSPVVAGSSMPPAAVRELIR